MKRLRDRRYDRGLSRNIVLCERYDKISDTFAK